MKSKIQRKIFLGFIYIHILHHASEDKIYGAWMIKELEDHGYDMSPGTLYPIFHTLENENFLKSTTKTVNGKSRKYYSITPEGEKFLEESREKLKELTNEI
ncbi:MULTISPECIES: PadR family transcriptional regulator [Staphylococcaceae]|uniref:PadR family transcriptional regulator n=1 Tax=Staphylococcaceae TaxID=90964 RepID=UPI000D1DEF46|nr:MULTISPECIES: PadR family transcriptional regulator [Staphylococcaceae]MBA1353264.1 PadR family transcriptional regulator [Staphylococcus cohnii]MBA1389996.1 PadR family transcriptional regulator [Staphylococcus cohnii]MBF2753183.1 helix-turn-helix transcriptional regulator [Staphylococcus saprophyticus]MBO1207146.1 helix-turn-helix transcriptional regulator [Mammaliicoccus sciuri]MBO3077540.1 helix-turn-helix transcriptional regulator [Mammaliicoccus vitulinus]